MKTAILKALRWYIVVCCLIAGFYFIFMAQQYDIIKPVMPAVLCFGFAYIVAFSWRELREKILFNSIVCVILSALAARYGWPYLYVLSGFRDIITMNGFLLWAILCLVFCVPYMSFVFYKYGRP